jgi:hypothetical protein
MFAHHQKRKQLIDKPSLITKRTLMKIINTSTALIPGITLGIILAMTGCSITGMDRSAKAGNTMESVQEDMQNAVTQIDITNAALEEVVKPGQSDAKGAFKKYSSEAGKMQKSGKKLFEHADQMSAQGKDYFEEWRTQGNTFTNPEIQALSEQRRADLNAVFAKIAESSVGVKGALKSYLTDISEIEAYLSNDLTPKGIEAITPVARAAISDGDSLKAAINPVLSAIGNARSELEQGGAK